MNEEKINKILRRRYEDEAESNWMMAGAFEAGARFALMRQWIHVDEGLPDFDEAVLVVDNTGMDGNGAYFNHRSDRADVKTYDNGFCDIGLSEVLWWTPVPVFPNMETADFDD